MRRWIVVLAIAVVVAGTSPAAAQEGDYVYDAGIGTACVFVNLLYMPAKFVYASLGGLTGSLAYVLTGLNFDTAEKIWTPSLGGNYVVTPSHLRNEEVLYFSGTVPAEYSSE